MSLFDPNSFLNETVTGALDTKYPVIPQGEYPAISKKIAVREMESSKEPGKKLHVLDITWGIDDAGVKEATKLPEPSARQSVFLDLKEENGRMVLDMGPAKNVGLGRLREAFGLNDPNQPFSFQQLVGQAAIVKIEHQPNPNDADNPYSNVTRVSTQ